MTTRTVFVWKTDVKNMPTETPVMCRVKGKDVPFIGERSRTDPDLVEYFLGPDNSGYGMYEEIANITGYISVDQAEHEETI